MIPSQKFGIDTPAERDAAGQHVPHGVAPHGGEDAGRDGDGQRDQQRQARPARW